MLVGERGDALDLSCDEVAASGIVETRWGETVVHVRMSSAGLTKRSFAEDGRARSRKPRLCRLPSGAHRYWRSRPSDAHSGSFSSRSLGTSGWVSVLLFSSSNLTKSSSM